MSLRIDKVVPGNIVFHNHPDTDITTFATLDTRYIKVAGGNSAPNIIIENDYLDGDITFKVNDGGVDKTVMTIDGATGNVGIGTTNPSYKLEVADAGRAFAKSFAVSSTAGDLINDAPQYGLGMSNLTLQGEANNAVQLSGFYGINFAESNAIRMTIHNGNVGIGTTSPSQQLEITGDFEIPNTTFADQSGIIYKGTAPFIHNFNYGNNGTVTTNGGNTFVGVNAGNFTMGSTATQTSHASYNTAIGTNALSSNTTGHNNTANGYQTLRYNTTGYQNSAMGVYALFLNTTGYYNSAMGYYALSSNTTGTYNTSMGTQALRYNTTGYRNSAIGVQALFTNRTGYYNSAMGMQALYNLKPTSGAITAFADYGGTVAGTVKATSAGHGLTGTVANIRISGTTNYDGLYTITVIDADNFYFTDTWVANDATGWWGKDTEGRYNTAFGYAAGDNITTGSNNIIIGANIDAPSATGDNQLNIGNAIYGNLSNGYVGIGTTSPSTRLHAEETKTIAAAIADGYSAAITINPKYTASTAQTVTRANYLDLRNPTLTNVTVTDAAVMRFDAAAGTHKAVDSGTTKTTPGTVDAWLKFNLNGTIFYCPVYTSKTS